MSDETGTAAFGLWLKRLRKARELTQGQLADEIGCSKRTIEKIETGERRPSRQIAQILAEYFDVPPAERELFVWFGRMGTTAPPPRRPIVRPPDSGGEAGANRGSDGHAVGAPGTGAPVGPAPWREGRRSPRDSLGNLPRQAQPFVGRHAELRQCRSLLRDPGVQLLTLTGPPGVGKSRLALQVAEELAPEFDHGTFFVSLAALTDPGQVVEAVAGVLGAGGMQGLASSESVRSFLIGKRLLLFLDNFEQVPDAALFVADLVDGCPLLKVLVTSREKLYLSMENEVVVAPMQTPPPAPSPLAPADFAPAHTPLPQGGGLDTASQESAVADLEAFESVRLFVQCARCADPSFKLETSNAGAVGELCRRLEGLPLAIQLAAVRVRYLPPRAIVDRLQSRLRLLTGGARDLPERQQTLLNAIEWSYSLLPYDQ